VPNPATIAAVLLAIVFVVAAAAKFRDPAATRRSMAEFGLPNPRLLAVAVPVTELATAALLLVDPRTGGPCAVALLVAFTTLIAGRLLAGHHESCGCFGTWAVRPLSWRDLVRNAALVALGVAAAFG
jgi:uncharacterized membrane protein YphA (DoxX/SURF4 family)|tara:strand:- start:1971 stop:2351 length:381 start_codon:yes stop_codon:yes gene_type:complete